MATSKTWPDGGAEPPRPGYYAEQAEEAKQRADNAYAADRWRAMDSYGRDAQMYATLELAAAAERARLDTYYDRVAQNG